MSIPNTLEAFLELGFRSGLLDKTAVDACCAQLAEHGGPPQKPQVLAAALAMGHRNLCCKEWIIAVATAAPHRRDGWMLRSRSYRSRSCRSRS